MAVINAYKKLVTLVKGGQVAGSAVVGGGIGLWLMGWVRAQWPDLVFWGPEEDEKAALVLAGLAAGLVKAIQNWAKNADSSMSDWALSALKLVKLACVALMVGAVVSGCAGLAPAVYGKTSYRMSFEDTVTAGVDLETGATTPGQTTTFDVDVKAPAGVKIEDLTSMAYEWKDGEGKIAVSKTATQDSMGQAEMIPLYAKIQSENFANAIGGVKAIAEIAAPLVGLNLQNSADDAARDDANRAATRAEIATIIREVLAERKTGEAPAAVGE